MVRPQQDLPKRPAAFRDWPATNRMPEEREITPREELTLTILGAVIALAVMAVIFGAVWWAIP